MREQIKAYESCTADLVKAHGLDKAMEAAVGGDFDGVGRAEADLLVKHGLDRGSALVDFGCGSGRLAKQLAVRFPDLHYTGIDVVQSMLDYAKSITKRPSFNFILNHTNMLPLANESADCICAFSVFTHLYLEQSYLYLKEMRRVVRPGGTILFSFLEIGKNWATFETSAAQYEAEVKTPLNMFFERNTAAVWSEKLGLSAPEFDDIGQTVAIVKRP